MCFFGYLNNLFFIYIYYFIPQVFPYHVPVKNLLVVRESGQLIVLSEQEVSAIALHRCHLANNSCGDCVALQDPYCAWHIRSNTCLPFRPGQNLEQLQNVNIGFHPQCPVPIGMYVALQWHEFIKSATLGEFTWSFVWLNLFG